MRRKLLFCALALLLAYSGYAWYVGLAFTAGIPTQDMDWNNDGKVDTREKLQAWYAVRVNKTHQGVRECNTFYWRGSKDAAPIRVDCKTTFGASSD
ncbi:MAG: EF-hand domain-containing protein [Luteimonas sp.]